MSVEDAGRTERDSPAVPAPSDAEGTPGSASRGPAGLADGGTLRGAIGGSLALVAIFAACFLVRLDAPGLVDYDEGCYAEVARVMYVGGEWLSPELNGEPFFEKPPLLYWAQIAGFAIFGIGELGARFLNALAAIGVVLLVHGFARRPLGGRAAFLAALLLGTSLEFFGLARVALTDMTLLTFLLLCLFSYHRASERWREDPRRGTGWFLAAAAFAGVAMLTKGAIGVVLPGAAALAHATLGRQWRALFRPGRLLAGGVLFASIGFSWYLMLGLTHEGGFGFMRELFLEHHVGRFSSPMQGHSGPVVYYVPVVLAGFLPWTPLLGLASLGTWRSLGAEARRFLGLCVLFGAITFAFFSVAATKLPNYALPVFPVVALVAATAVTARAESWRSGERSGRWAVVSSAVAVAGLGVVCALLPFVLDRLPELLGEDALKEPGLSRPIELGWGPWVIAAVLVAAGVLGVVAARRARPLVGLHVAALGFAAGLVVVSLTLVPAYDEHFRRPIRDLARDAASRLGPDERLVLVGIRHAPSLNFYGSLQTEYVGRNESKMAAFFDAGPPRLGIVREVDLPRVESAIDFEPLVREGGYVLFRSRPAG